MSNVICGIAGFFIGCVLSEITKFADKSEEFDMLISYSEKLEDELAEQKELVKALMSKKGDNNE